MKVELVERRLIFPPPSLPLQLRPDPCRLLRDRHVLPSPAGAGPIRRQLPKSLWRVGRLLVAYDFVARRLVQAADEDRLEIDCNDAGAIVATVTTASELSELGDLRRPKPEFKKLVSFLQDEGQELFDKHSYFCRSVYFIFQYLKLYIIHFPKWKIY